MIKLKCLLLESKQSIINLGYPKLIAVLLYEKFGKNAFTIARWYKEYYSHGNIKNDWWKEKFYSFGSRITLNDLVNLYYATNDPEAYKKMLIHLDLTSDNTDYNESYLMDQREHLRKNIEDQFFRDVFFVYNVLINDIMNGKLKDIKPYANLSYADAEVKYDEKRVFDEMTPTKVYDNGYKWINVGKRCHIVGLHMKNCGSAGLMSTDPDRTIMALFDANNKPHVLVTYSPNEHRISGDEGASYSEVKPEYHTYVLDLANTLGAVFDTGRTKSKLLKLKYLLRNKVSDVKKLKISSTYFEYYKFNMDGKNYYSNGSLIVSEEDVKKIVRAIKDKKIELRYEGRNILSAVLDNYNNANLLKSIGIKYIADWQIPQWIAGTLDQPK